MIRKHLTTALLSAILALCALGTASAQLMEMDEEKLPIPTNDKKDKQATVTPCMVWIDDNTKPKGFLLCVHGLGLHKGTYHQFGERMAPLGWGVYAVDVRGFGSFQTMPGTTARSCDFEGCLQDVKAALELIHKEHPGAPVVIVGESMGGGISLQATSRYPELVDGLISSVPGAQRYHQAADSVKVGLHMVAGPKKTMDVTNIVVNRSTEKEELRNEWLKDSLARFQLSPMELMQFQMFMSDNSKAAKKITKTPVLMMSGTDDKLVKHVDQEKLIYDIPSPDSMQVYVHGAEHLILEEGQFDDSVIELVTTWLDEHILHQQTTASKPAAAATAN